jgi:hypothetical protein
MEDGTRVGKIKRVRLSVAYWMYLNTNAHSKKAAKQSRIAWLSACVSVSNITNIVDPEHTP